MCRRIFLLPFLSLLLTPIDTLNADNSTPNTASQTQSRASVQNDSGKDQTLFIVVRHGESDHNVRNVFNSRPDHAGYFESHLTKHGRNQATATGEILAQKYFVVSSVFRGPLPRTIETSDIINSFLHSKHVETDPRLIEAGAGDLEGKSNSDVKDNWGIEDIAVHFHGESREAMRERLCSFMQDMVQKHRNEVTLIVTHGSPSEMILKILGAPRSRLDTAEAAIAPYPGSLQGCKTP